MHPRRPLVLLALLVLAAGLGAQEFSEKKEVAVFKLNYFGAPVYAPSNITVSATIGNVTVSASVQGSGNANADAIFQQTIAQVDATIQREIQNMGRFTVLAMPQRLSTADLPSFIQAIKDYKSENLVIPQAVSLGRQTFTQADFNKLVGSFVIIIPSVTYYNLYYDDGAWEAEITTEVSVVDVAANQTIGSFKIETTGSEVNEAAAMKAAVDGIPVQLVYQLRSVPAFRISTGITDLRGSDVILEFGTNMGIMKGDEYHIARSGTVGRYNTEDAVGLVVIKDVREQFSVAQVIRMDDGKPVVGDQLRELPRMGFDIDGYINFLTVSGGETDGAGLALGAKVAVSRGFYDVRPIVGVEILFSENIPVITTWWGTTFIPVAAYVGAEYVMYLGRIKVVPQAGIGTVYYVSADTLDDPDPFQYLTHFRAHVKAQAAYLINDDLYGFGEIGVQGNLSIRDFIDSFSAISVGAGVSFKL